MSVLYSGMFLGQDVFVYQCLIYVYRSGTYYPVHPIDTVAPQGFDEHGNVKCVGMFTYLPKGVGVGQSALGLRNSIQMILSTHLSLTDFILGDTFLRNVYSLFDFGTWTNGVTSPPYMQLLSVGHSCPFFQAHH